MRYHCGAAHSCSSLADLVIKNSQRFKEKLALNRWLFFNDQIGKTRAAMGRAEMMTHSFIIIRTPAHYIPVKRARGRLFFTEKARALTHTFIYFGF